MTTQLSLDPSISTSNQTIQPVPRLPRDGTRDANYQATLDSWTGTPNLTPTTGTAAPAQPIDQVNPGAPIPGNPGVPIVESGSPQIGPLPVTGSPVTGGTGTTPPTTTTPPAGGNVPPTGGTPTTGGTLPDGTQVPTYGLGGLVGLDFMRQVTPNELVSNQINALTSGNSAYMENARRRGAEFANSRGNLNSSIGAGASMRAALEAAMPIAQQDAGTYAAANTQNAGALNDIRQAGINSFLSQNDSLFNAQAQDWLANNQFNREFNGQLALMPIANAADMWSGLMDLATQNPEVFTPDVLAGYQDFFQQGVDEYISRYLGGP